MHICTHEYLHIKKVHKKRDQMRTRRRRRRRRKRRSGRIKRVKALMMDVNSNDHQKRHIHISCVCLPNCTQNDVCIYLCSAQHFVHSPVHLMCLQRRIAIWNNVRSTRKKSALNGFSNNVFCVFCICTYIFRLFIFRMMCTI